MALSQELRERYRRAINEMEGRDPMPAMSGVDPPSGIRLSASFFRCVEREWMPKTIDDPDFPHLVYKAGKEYGRRLRELRVVRMLQLRIDQMERQWLSLTASQSP